MGSAPGPAGKGAAFLHQRTHEDLFRTHLQNGGDPRRWQNSHVYFLLLQGVKTQGELECHTRVGRTEVCAWGQELGPLPGDKGPRRL